MPATLTLLILPPTHTLTPPPRESPGRRHYLNPQLIKSYIWQLMKSLDHMHKKGIFHRDIKPENILIESSTDIGRGLKLADFGSCRGIYSKQPYTEYISTRWYRAPECLLTDGYYGPEMDLWGAGCVMFEITSLYPLFPGSNEVDQISRIHKVLGTPGQDILQKFRSRGASHISFDFPPQKGIGIPQLIPHAAADGVDLMVKLLKYDAAERITAREALRHPYFRDIRETEQRANQAAQAGGASDNASVAGSVGIKSVSSNKTSASAAASVVQGGQMKMPQQGGAPIAKALPSIIGTGADGVQMPAQLNASQQMAMSKQPGLQAQYQQQQKQQQGMVGQGGQVGASALPPIGQQQQLLQQQQAQAQYQQQMQMQQQQGQYGAGAQMQRAVQPSAALAGSARNEPNRRRKKYRMTYGQQVCPSPSLSLSSLSLPLLSLSPSPSLSLSLSVCLLDHCISPHLPSLSPHHPWSGTGTGARSGPAAGGRRRGQRRSSRLPAEQARGARAGHACIRGQGRHGRGRWHGYGRWYGCGYGATEARRGHECWGGRRGGGQLRKPPQ